MAEEFDAVSARQQLLGKKLGVLLNWRMPGYEVPIGPSDRELLQRFDAKRATLIDRCQARLEAFSEVELRSIIANLPDANGPRKAWLEFLTNEIDGAVRRTPPWYAGGLGHPDYAADFQYWCQMEYLSVAELLCLTVGVEPKHFPEKELRKLSEASDTRHWSVPHFLARQHDLLLRRFDPRRQGWTVMPVSFLAWAEQNGFEAHPEFLHGLRRVALAQDDLAARTGGGRTVDQREVNTVSRLLTVMAIAQFRYDPSKPRSKAPKEIADFAATQGISISEETIRKYLRIGAGKLERGRQDE